jgi:hypothetical protein
VIFPRSFTGIILTVRRKGRVNTNPNQTSLTAATTAPRP